MARVVGPDHQHGDLGPDLADLAPVQQELAPAEGLVILPVRLLVVAGLAQAPAFVLGAFIWIFIHGAFCLAGAWIFRVDVHSVAIASAANIGAAASAPIVAAHHKPSLVPVSVLMALLGYAMGNYLAPLTGYLAKFAAGQ